MKVLPYQFKQKQYWEFYCPICKVQRRSFYWPSPRISHYIKLALVAVTVTAVLWPWCGIKGAFLIFPVWAVFEFVYRLKARQSLICSYCGFDPYLYKYDVKLARQKVEKFWSDKKRNKDELTRNEPESSEKQS